MDTTKRFDVMHELAARSPGLGKTAMMKYLFLLQQVYDVPLDYNFEIYTYGPYSSEVMVDLDLAKCLNVISIDAESYSGYVGYSINVKDCPEDKSLSDSTKYQVDELLKSFGRKSAKELELSTTIVYLYRNYKMNSWDCSREVIINDVHEIKPHFPIDTIIAEYDNLDMNGILKKAV